MFSSQIFSEVISCLRGYSKILALKDYLGSWGEMRGSVDAEICDSPMPRSTGQRNTIYRRRNGVQHLHDSTIVHWSSQMAKQRRTIICEPWFPLQHSKMPRTLNLSRICPRDCFWGFQSGGLEFVKNCQNLSENYRFSNVDKFLTNSSPPDWNPQK